MKNTTLETLRSHWRREVWRGALIFAVSLLLTGVAVASPVGPSDPDGPDRAPGTSPAHFAHEVNSTSFAVQMVGHASAGRYLVDIEVRWDGTQERYTAVWFPVSGTIHTLIHGTTAPRRNGATSSCR